MMKFGEVIVGLLLALLVLLTMIVASVTALFEIPRYLRIRFK